MWCPVDIRDYEQWSGDRESVCGCERKSGSSVWSSVLFELLTLVVSRNTTLATRMVQL